MKMFRESGGTEVREYENTLSNRDLKSLDYPRTIGLEEAGPRTLVPL